jgi:beta-lactamase class A
MMAKFGERKFNKSDIINPPDDQVNNVISPYDCALFFADLVHQETLSNSAYNRMKVPLFNQKHTHMFPKYLPHDSEIAHKTGSIPSIALDTGVLFVDRPLVFSVAVSQVEHSSDGADIIGEIGDIVNRFVQ